MVGYKMPVFEDGMILSREMLEALREYATEFSLLQYEGYSDGILCGCKVSMNDNTIWVNRGILKYADKLFFISEKMQVNVTPGNEWKILKVHIGEVFSYKNMMVGEITPVICDALDQNEDEIEICRFRLQNGACLRNEYRDFFDLNTEFDTVCEIHATWSGYGEKTVSRRLLQEYAKAMMMNVSNPVDIAFVMQILGLGTASLNRNVIEVYLAARTNRQYTHLSNAEIYKGLCDILRNPGTSKVHEGSDKQQFNRRIIVD